MCVLKHSNVKTSSNNIRKHTLKKGKYVGAQEKGVRELTRRCLIFKATSSLFMRRKNHSYVTMLAVGKCLQ